LLEILMLGVIPSLLGHREEFSFVVPKIKILD